MIIYNVTVNIDESAHDEWLQWMRKVHIPDVMSTGLFLSNRMCRILVEEEMGGISYAIQYTAKDKETLEQYQCEHAPRLQKAHTERYKDRFVAFRTFLEVVHEQ